MTEKKRSERFNVVLMLAERQEQLAATRLSQSYQQLTSEQQQLAQLQSYNEDYIKQMGALRQGVYSGDLMGYSYFLQRLATAVANQGEKITLIEETIANLQADWQQKHLYRESIANLIERIAEEENMDLEKQLQRELDQLAVERQKPRL